MRFSTLERLDDPQRMRSAAVEMTTDTKRGPRDRAPHFRVSAHTGPSAWNARVFPRWATFHSVLSLHVTTLVKCPGHPLYSKTLFIFMSFIIILSFIWSISLSLSPSSSSVRLSFSLFLGGWELCSLLAVSLVPLKFSTHTYGMVELCSKTK